MKKYIYLLLTIVFIGTSGCFDEYDGTADLSQPWVRFELPSMVVSEGIGDKVTATLFLSGPIQTDDVVIPFKITSEDNLVEGTDFTQPNSSFTIPAGKNIAIVTLLEGVTNDDAPTGNRSLTITLDDTQSFRAGFPGPARTNNSITINIAEDDFTTIAFTSFEEPEGLDEDYVDTGDPAVARELQNNPGQAPVQFTSTGGELGFKTFYIPNGGEGSTDGDDLGVTTKSSIVGDTPQGGYVDGVQGYYADDTDGQIRIVFDEVDVSKAKVLQFRMSYLFNDTGWETEDFLSVKIESGGGDVLEVLTLNGDDIDDMGLDPEPHIWHFITADISELIAAGTVKLILEFQSNSGAEEVYFDNIVFEGIL